MSHVVVLEDPRRVTAVPLVEEWRAFRRVPLAARLWCGLLVLLALALPWARPGEVRTQHAAFVAVLVLLGLLNVELGRAAEGGSLVLRQRPHKALSAWPFAAALVAPAVLLPPAVLVTYWWTRRRGMRVPLWKWVGSGAVLVLAGTAVDAVVGAGRPTPLDVGLGALLFLAVEAGLLAVCARVNDAQDEAWLRAQLRSAAFHGNELGVLLSGAAVAVLWLAGPLYVLLAVPGFVTLQRALLVEPLRTEAETDGKTGLLHYGAWRAVAEPEVARHDVNAVLFVDLDHFKAVNDTYGHVVGDHVLAEVCSRLVGALRGQDLPGRFGGEEFCVLLPGTGLPEARAVADRLRALTCARPVNGMLITVSVGVGVAAPGAHAPLDALLAAADSAVYVAKDAGRDRTEVQVVGPVPVPRVDTALRASQSA